MHEIAERSCDPCAHATRDCATTWVTALPFLVLVGALGIEGRVMHASKRPRREPDQPIRWGIMGAGMISHDFVSALKALSSEEGSIVAVGARDLASAKRFAEELGIERAHEGYEALAADPEVDVVYVGTVAQTHAACARLALAAGKPCLVEKPLTLSAEETAALTAEARAAGLFLMEGMWTRCFPSVRRARELLAGGAIGTVRTVAADFGWPASTGPDGRYETGEHARLLNASSGGVSMDVAMYPIAHVLLAAGAAMPTRVVATGTVQRAAGGEGFVDWSMGAALSGFPQLPGLTATVLCTLEGSTPEEVVYTGTKGTLRVHRPAHAPPRLTLSIAASREEAAEQVLDFDVADKAGRSYHYPGSEGFVFEARAVHAALRAGLLEPPEWTHEESVTTQAIVDRLRAAVIEDAGARKEAEAQ